VNRPLQVAVAITVAGVIYSWMVAQALRDAKRAVGRRFWPGPPIDYP